MPPRITNVILDCTDVRLLARFWSGLLGREVEHDGPDFVFFKAAEGQPGFGLQIAANGGRTLSENAIGDFRWTTVADPEGNEFDVHE